MGREMSALEVGGVDPLVEHHWAFPTIVCSISGHDDVRHLSVSYRPLPKSLQGYMPDFRVRKYLVAKPLETGRLEPDLASASQAGDYAGSTMRM
jgi:hypothetical protein